MSEVPLHSAAGWGELSEVCSRVEGPGFSFQGSRFIILLFHVVGFIGKASKSKGEGSDASVHT